MLFCLSIQICMFMAAIMDFPLFVLLKLCMNKAYRKNITKDYVTGQWQLPQST